MFVLCFPLAFRIVSFLGLPACTQLFPRTRSAGTTSPKGSYADLMKRNWIEAKIQV